MIVLVYYSFTFVLTTILIAVIGIINPIDAITAFLFSLILCNFLYINYDKKTLMQTMNVKLAKCNFIYRDIDCIPYYNSGGLNLQWLKCFQYAFKFEVAR